MGVHRASLVRYADYAITHSSYTKNELVETYGFPAERIYVLPYVVSIDRFGVTLRNPRLQKRYGLDGHFVLLYVGRMAGQKKIDHLVEALALVKTKIPNVKLLLAGDATSPTCQPYFQQAWELAKEKGIQQDVLFLGIIPHEELKDYYNLADIYVTTSFHETFCIPVIEAMACGKPVIGTNIAALPQTIGDAGLTFQPGNISELATKIVELLSSPKLYQELSQKGLERAKLFTRERYEEHLDEMVEMFTQKQQPLAPQVER